MNIQEQIASTISRLGVSQNQLAAMSGVSQSVISRAVRGKRSITVATLEKLWPFLYGEAPQQRASGE